MTKLDTAFMIGFPIFAVVAGTLLLVVWPKVPEAPWAGPSASVSPIRVPPAPVLSVYNASPSLDDLPDDPSIKRKDAMLERCAMGGGIAVLGYGWRVVCLKPAMVEWWDDPHNEPRSKP